MPRNGYYFDALYVPLADANKISDIDEHMDRIESYDRPGCLDKTYEELALKAKESRANTDYALIGRFGGHVFQSSQALRGWDRFLRGLVANRKFAEALMDRFAEAGMRRFRSYAETVGKHVDNIHVEDDLGMQDRLLLSHEMYRGVVQPYHRKLSDFIKSECDAYLMPHTDGWVYPLIPDFIEMGVDILNPVPVSAKNMDPKKLKKGVRAEPDLLGRWARHPGGACLRDA